MKVLPGTRAFAELFSRRARGVRTRTSLDALFGGLASGALAALACALLGWRTGLSALRYGGPACLALGAWVALARHRRRRWSDTDVALFLDEKLDSAEVIVTALGLGDRTDAPANLVVKSAMTALARELPKGSGPRVFRGWHALLPVACAATVWVARLELPLAPPFPAALPGAEVIALETLEGLDQARALWKLAPLDAAQGERLRSISERAERLKVQLAKGMPRREAQAELSRLRDDVTAERQRLGAGNERRGLEAALAKLANVPQLGSATRALGDRDLTEFDEEMETLANRLEADDRERAKKTIAEAAEAARRDGAKGVASALDEQKTRLSERGEGAEALRELGKALGESLSPEGKRALEKLGQTGSPEHRSELGQELGKAIEGLSDAERKRLAERLKESASDLAKKGKNGANGKELQALREDLLSPDGQRRLVETLKELSKPPSPSENGAREHALGDAVSELSEGESRLQQPSLVPLPMLDGSQKPGDLAAQKNAGRDRAKGSSGGDPMPGGGSAEHGAGTAPVAAQSVRARASAKLNPGAPNAGSVLGRTPGRVGETALSGGEGGLRTAAPGELSGADRSEIPREYREQVGRYFPAR